MSIAKKAVQGVAWNITTGIGARIIQLAGTLILTRFIAPGEYGEVSAAVVAVTTANQLTFFGFGQYLIAKKPAATVAFEAAVLHLLLGVGAMGAVYLLRNPIGALVDAPEMGRFVPGLAAALILERARHVPQRLLVRDLRFRTVAIVNSLGELTFTATALALAPYWGGMAIIAGTITRSLLTAVLYFGACPRAEWLVWAPLRGETIRSLFNYGTPLMLGSVADTAASKWDNLFMSRLFGVSVMGRYNLAYNLAETPISYVAEHIGDVLMPSFSRMEPADRPTAVIRASALMALVVAPLGVGLGAVAPALVHALFDERWAEMAPMLVILSVMTVFRPMTWSAIAYLQAEQHTRLIMTTSFLRAALLLALVYLFGTYGGPLLACSAAGVAYAIHSVITIVATGRLTGLPVGPYLLGVARPLVACVPMFAAVTGLHMGLVALGVPLLVALVAEVLAGAAVYVGAVFVVAPATARQLVNLAREALRKRRGATEAA